MIIYYSLMMPGSKEHEKRRVSYSPDHVAAAEKAARGERGERKSRRLQCGGAPSLVGGTTGSSGINGGGAAPGCSGVSGSRLLLVVVFMDSAASDALNSSGYSCHGCRVRGADFAVGTLNRGDRLNPWCIKCFMEQEYCSFDIDTSMHVPHDAVMYVNGLCRTWYDDATAEPISPERYGELRVRSHDVQTKLRLLGGPPGWGCKDAMCDGCEEVNCCLGTWVPEVKPWYNEKKKTDGTGGAGSDRMEEPVPSTPSGAGAVRAVELAGENTECPGTDESDKTVPYNGELPNAGAGENYSGATLETLASHGDEIGRLLDNLGDIMRDIVRDRFWYRGATTELLYRLSDAESVIYHLRRKMGRVDAAAGSSMDEDD